MSNSTPTIMPQIKTVVFLMLENRSLDNLLGWLYKDDKPKQVIPENTSKDYDGLQSGSYSNPDVEGNPVPITAITDIRWSEIQSNQWGVPYADPYEALRAVPSNDPRAPINSWHGVMNQFYGNQNIIDALPDTRNSTPSMQGFLQDYYSSGAIWDSQDILWTYTPTQLNVINGLARNYSVSDRWFCSVPTETNPNRAFSLCGTSLGYESNKNIFALQTFDTPTLFNRLAEAGKSWGLYYQDSWLLTGECYTAYTFPQLKNAANGEIASMNTFYSHASAGTLPAFSYLEPAWTYAGKQGNDYHPPGYLGDGESFLQQVFTSLQQSPQWKDMLFIITFDEHGGTYDHVSPPGTAINPDGIIGIENGFGFNQFGARVPTLFISPYVNEGTVFRSPDGPDRPFDHTSFIKTLLLWAGVQEEDMNLGERVRNAPTFESVLSSEPVNSSVMKIQNPMQFAGDAIALHPAGTNEELQILMNNIPCVPARYILAKNKTKEEIATAVKDYTQNPQLFLDEVLACLRT